MNAGALECCWSAFVVKNLDVRPYCNNFSKSSEFEITWTIIPVLHAEQLTK